MLTVGTKVKDFTLPDQHAKPHRLSQYLGKKVVIYFYPKDDTPGCTTQACAFRDTFHDFKDLDVVVIGISKDSVAAHKRFVEKYNLPFILLSDEKAEIATYFGVYGEKSMYGKKYMGINRTTFIIDETGTISHVFEKASPSENASEILSVLR